MCLLTITLIPHYDSLYEILDLLLPINTQRHIIFGDSLLSLLEALLLAIILLFWNSLRILSSSFLESTFETVRLR